MGKAFTLTKEEVLRIPETLHNIFLEFKNTGSLIILYYFLIELFEFIAILSVNNYRATKKEKKEESGEVGSYNSVIRYLKGKSGKLFSLTEDETFFLKAFSQLRHKLTHDLDKFNLFENNVIMFIDKYNYSYFDRLFTVIEVRDIEVSGVNFKDLRDDIKFLCNWSKQWHKRNNVNLSLKQSAVTSDSTLDAIANINKKYDI